LARCYYYGFSPSLRACGRLPAAMAGPVLLPSPQRQQPALTLRGGLPRARRTGIIQRRKLPGDARLQRLQHRRMPSQRRARRRPRRTPCWPPSPAAHSRGVAAAGYERSLAGRRTDQITHICACHEAALSQPAAAQIESSLFPVSRGWQQEAASPPLISWCRAGYGAVPPVPLGCCASHCARRACGHPWTPEPDAAPAGLTARARPKARPERARRTATARRLSGG
jgi:hypothetical protein